VLPNATSLNKQAQIELKLKRFKQTQSHNWQRDSQSQRGKTWLPTLCTISRTNLQGQAKAKALITRPRPRTSSSRPRPRTNITVQDYILLFNKYSDKSVLYKYFLNLRRLLKSDSCARKCSTVSRYVQRSNIF
jgi:hypothetical protein